MVNFNKDDKKNASLDFVSSITLGIYLAFVGYLVFSFLTVGGALENPANSQKFWTYMILAISTAFVLFLAKLENFLTAFFNLRANLPKNIHNMLGGFDAFIHEPRYSILKYYFPKDVWWLNAFDLTLFSVLAGLIMGFFSLLFSTSIQQVYSFLFEQQITKTAEFGLAIEPAVFGETMSFLLLMGLIWGVSKYLVNKGIQDIKSHFFFTLAILPIIGGFIWVGLHNAIYGADARGIVVTWGWGWFQAFAGLLFVSVIPAYILHATNNAFDKARELFSSEATFIVVFLLIIVISTIIAIRVSQHRAKTSS